jgi:hypothetical protein
MEAARNTYRGLMVEAKARLLSINTFANDQRGIPSQLIREFGALQIRMLCEIVGLACLVAHGDIVERSSEKLQTHYEPGRIFAALEELHPRFFPFPIAPQKTSNGWHMAEYAGGPFATKAEIKEIWSKCGEILHKGSLKKLVKPRNPLQIHFADIEEWGKKISNLLTSHSILSVDQQTVWIALLASAGDVQVVYGTAI